VLPLMAVAILLVGALLFVVGRVGAAAVDRARARTAADASALAGAEAGETAAREEAEANGGRLLRYERRGLDTRVVVEVGRAQAVARARREVAPPSSVQPSRCGMHGCTLDRAGAPGSSIVSRAPQAVE
jgi:hypothetical protein